MKQYRTDEVTSEREEQIAAIKKVLPDFQDEGKSDDYISAYYDVVVGKQNEDVKDPEQEDDEEIHGDSADEIQQMKNARLNLRGSESKQEHLHKDSANADIESMKQSRLNMRGN